MKLLTRIGLGGQLLLIATAVIIVDLLVNSIVFGSARVYAMQEEDAAWLAENTAISHRIMDRTPVSERPAIAKALTTERFEIYWSPQSGVLPRTVTLSALRRQMLAAEPYLRSVRFEVSLRPLALSGGIHGSTQLNDGSIITFNYRQHVPWKLNISQSLGILIPSLLLLAAAWRMVQAMLRPLRTLAAATKRVGTRQPVHIPEAGSGDVLQMIRAFNAMQERIHQLLSSRSQTMLAIAHDFRTPLARLRLRIEDNAVDPILRKEIDSDIAEMDDLLKSLQIFVESGQDDSPRQRLDIAVTAQTLVSEQADLGKRAAYYGPDHCEIMVRPVAFRRILTNLVRNAIAYGGNADVTIRAEVGLVRLVIDDNGPGIPAEQHDEVLRPFTRLDAARARNTSGMGLGLAIVDRLVRAENGILELEDREAGGLRVTVMLPAALD